MTIMKEKVRVTLNSLKVKTARNIKEHRHEQLKAMSVSHGKKLKKMVKALMINYLGKITIAETLMAQDTFGATQM